MTVLSRGNKIIPHLRKRISAFLLASILNAVACCYGRVVLKDSRTSVSTSVSDAQSEATLRFYGSTNAILFTKELQASLQGTLEKNFVGTPSGGFPAGFVNASLPNFGWAGTMWTRDGGTYMRELVMRGYFTQASMLAECLMHLVTKNDDGYYAFPEYFKGSEQASGKELDGTASIVIGMVLLWQRLEPNNPTRTHIQQFLFSSTSPLSYFQNRLKQKHLLAGSGEFGCGWNFSGECVNVVQNNLVILALESGGNMAAEMGRKDTARTYRKLAQGLRRSMDRYLVANDGSWIWAVDPVNLKPDPAVLSGNANLGFGGINGVVTMYADVLGLLPLDSSWKGIAHSQRTFEKLYEIPLRKVEFNRHGIWTQFDIFRAGLTTSPSYGQGYAAQAMLLLEKPDMAARAIDFLADATYKPIPQYTLHRDSPYYFYERYYPPEAVGKTPIVEGCGALNLVNVSEPLKVSRLILGIDDSSEHPAYHSSTSIRMDRYGSK